MAKARQVLKGKILKKEWHPIKAGKAFDSQFLGESYVTSPDALIDRHLTINLANLTGDIRQQGISLKFRIAGIDDGAGVAEVTGYEASQAQLKRLVRRGVDRLDDSVECATVDGRPVRIKPFAVTKTAASKQKLKLVRLLLRKSIAEEVAKHNFDELLKLVIANNFQASLKAAAKKVLPLKALEIRRMEMMPGAAVPNRAEGAPEVAKEAGQPEEEEAKPARQAKQKRKVEKESSEEEAAKEGKD